MGQAKVEPLPGLTGFAEVLGEQFQEAPDPFFNAPQPQQGQERLRLAVAGGHGLGEAKRQLRGMLQLSQIAAELIAIGERYSLVGLHICECRTKGFIGTHKAKHQFIAMHRQRPQLHHAANHKPNAVLQQRNETSRGDMNNISIVVAAFKKRLETQSC